jgi:uncharacterized protein YlzI (FlbEa/FlbD family)
MPKFIHLEESPCAWVFINPKYIVTIRANPDERTATVIMAAGDPVIVDERSYEAILEATEE